MKRVLTAALVLLGLVPVSRAAAADPREDYARALLAERDYYRAITVLKELAFFASDPAQRLRYAYEIGQAYRLSGRGAHALATFLPLLQAPADEGLRARLWAQVGFAYVVAGSPGAALEPLEQARQLGRPDLEALGLGFVDLRGGQLAEAAARFDQAARAAPAPDEQRLSEGLARSVREAEASPRKRPWLAGALSAVIPGAGQIYTGHTFDAVQAFGFVGAFGFGTFLAFQHDRDAHNPYILTALAAAITATFHAANIAGAVRTASYANERARQVHLAPAEEALGRFAF